MDALTHSKKKAMEKEVKNKGGKWYMMALGIILMPIFFVTFIMDRFLMVFMVMGNGPDILEYYQDMKYIGISILRSFMVILVVSFLYWLWR